MYSFYRAWLTLGPCGAIPPFHPAALPPPSSPLNLSANSSIPGAPDVTLQVGPGLTQFSAHKGVLATHSGFFKAAIANQTGPITVPNVNVDEFSSLLTFMYTGYLDLNITNIYNILLATHILHMPRALEICRSFLLQTQPPDIRTNIIKPIPSRKAALPSQEIYPPTYSCLNKSEDTPFKEVNSKETSVQQKPSTSKTEDMEIVVEIQQSTSQKKHPLEKQKQKKRQTNPNEKVIIDIACCDGPVKFHRVINKNYGIIPSVEVYQRQEINQNEVLNKVMNENIRDRLEDENQNNEVFTCIYCNHTFKSQYCYQKHARRHLNPINMQTKAIPKETKREVKLLDMNVQYYPCKTCGSKFPSYYFVHKHRKLCHAEEMADNNNKNNEMVPENVENTDSSCSAIDVVAVNSEK